MIAWLGMYDMPALQPVNDRLWAAIRERLGDGPAKLDREVDGWEAWQSDRLLFAQTCGLPYRARLHGHVGLVGTPDYGLPGCPPGHYNSVLVVRADDPRQTLVAYNGARFAYNDELSQSGWAAPFAHFFAAGLTIGPRVKTGAHAASVEAVRNSTADIAALDALTWALLQENRPEAVAGLRELERTAPTPALPYITGARQDADRIADAVETAIGDLAQQDREAMHLSGLVRIPATEYLALPIPPAP